jgi:hypothetical protein
LGVLTAGARESFNAVADRNEGATGTSIAGGVTVGTAGAFMGLEDEVSAGDCEDSGLEVGGCCCLFLSLASASSLGFDFLRGPMERWEFRRSRRSNRLFAVVSVSAAHTWKRSGSPQAPNIQPT